MHDGGTITWRDAIDRHHRALIDELQVSLDSDRLKTVEEARQNTQRAITESLNQAVRRLRDVPSEVSALHLLTESSSGWARRAVVLLIENNQARSLGSNGAVEHEANFMFDIETAPAVAAAIESRDPVVALASPAEISPALAAALGGDPAGKAYLFPVVVRQNVIAMLAASDELAPAALELLCQAVALRIESLRAETPAALKPLPNPELVQIAAPAVPASETAERRAWNDLTPEEQKLHLQAQRVARVKVAEMRLYQAEALRKGVFDGNVYGALRVEIDAARAEFLQTFLSKSPTMVDYLHLEILRSLAHEDDRILGSEYPGPMV